MSFPAAFLARHAAREIRALLGKGALFVACLATGVAAVVSVAAMADAIEEGLREKARELLAADVVVSSRHDLPAALESAARAIPGARVARVTELYSMASAEDGRSQLVDLKAVDEGWPFHGSVVTDPAEPLASLLRGDGALVAPALARRLGLRPGDALRLGESSLRVTGFLLAEPDHALGRVALAPRVVISQESAERTQLLGARSRQQRKLLVAVPEGGDAQDAEAAAAALTAAAGGSPYVEIETHLDAQPELRQEIRRAERFLGLVALLSLVIGGAGIAQASRAWLRSRMDAVALLRCLGLRPREVLLLFAALAAALGLGGSVIGVVAGSVLVSASAPLLAGLVEGVRIEPWQPSAAVMGIALGLLTALAFSLPTLSDVLRVPALRALRSSAEPPPPRRGTRALVVAGLLVAGIAAASAQSGSLLRGALFTAVLAATALALAAGAAGLVRLLGALLPGLRVPWLRLAAASSRRPGSGLLSATVALGLGVLVVLTVALVQTGLRSEILARLPAAAPSTFLIDIQPEQWPPVRELLEREGATNVLSTPMLTARLRSIDGRDVAELAKERDGGRDGAQDGGRGGSGGGRGGGRSAWALTREQRLTWWSELPEDNTIVAGALWSDPLRAEASVEEEFARDIGVGLGAVLVLDVQGVPVEVTVTSLRKVEWRTFRINFFLVVEPGVLEDAPHSVLAAARLPDGREEAVQDALVAIAPNVTAIPIRDALARLADLVLRLAAGVRAVGAFSVVAGLVILAGAVAAGAGRRGAEIALLKTLGMTRREIVSMLLAENAMLGLVAGMIGAAGASVLSHVVLVRIMELPSHARPELVIGGVVLTTALAAACGTIASQRALRSRPVEALRREE